VNDKPPFRLKIDQDFNLGVITLMPNTLPVRDPWIWRPIFELGRLLATLTHKKTPHDSGFSDARVAISLLEDAPLIINYLPWLFFVILLWASLFEPNIPEGSLPQNSIFMNETRTSYSGLFYYGLVIGQSVNVNAVLAFSASVSQCDSCVYLSWVSRNHDWLMVLKVMMFVN